MRLLGTLTLTRGDVVLANLGSRSTAALLARLAMSPSRRHAREELMELLWPGVAPDVGRNRLRQCLFTLRRLLEPPGPIARPVLVADRLTVGLVEGALACDVPRFERLVREGRYAEALALHGGELLPGFNDEWVHDERLRLDALFDRASAGVEKAAGAQSTAPPAPVATAIDERRRRSDDAVVAARGALPVYLTRFIGRDAAVAHLHGEVLAHRLVTLLGPGGSGKTRLAVELATALRAAPQDASFDFVAFVPLVSCATGEQFVDALLASLRLQARNDGDPLAPLVTALDGRRALLVLDNFEQLDTRAAELVAQMLARVAGLHLLTSSRRVLGLDGERELAIQPLALPHSGLALAEAAVNPAVALFVDRARAVRADFHVRGANLAALIGVVRLLEGLPLAIELAAARVRSIAPAAMVTLLREAQDTPSGSMLALLARAGPRAGGDARHASMLHVVEWSWRLLAPEARQLLAALTVFRGGCTAAAAHHVCGPLADAAGLRLDDLVSQSLLRVDEADDGASRYTVLEPVREYAALQSTDAQARERRARHRAWVGAWAGALAPTPPLAALRAEMPNVLAALAGATADGDPGAAIAMLLPLQRAFEDVELPAEGLAALERAIEQCGDARLRDRGHTLLAPLLFIAGRSADALRHAEAGLAGAPDASARRGRALAVAARVRWRITRQEAGVLDALDAAESVAVAAGDAELLADVQAQRAVLLDFRGDHEAAMALRVRSLAGWRGTGNQHLVSRGLYSLAMGAQNAGLHAQALAQLNALEPQTRALQDWRRLSQLLNVRGNALAGLRRWDEAVDSFREAARLAWECLALHEIAYVLWNLPRALAHLREPERAVELAAFAQALWVAHFGQLSAGDMRDLRRVRRLAACQVGARRVEALMVQGAQLSLADAMALALR